MHHSITQPFMRFSESDSDSARFLDRANNIRIPIWIRSIRFSPWHGFASITIWFSGVWNRIYPFFLVFSLDNFLNNVHHWLIMCSLCLPVSYLQPVVKTIWSDSEYFKYSPSVAHGVPFVLSVTPHASFFAQLRNLQASRTFTLSTCYHTCLL